MWLGGMSSLMPKVWHTNVAKVVIRGPAKIKHVSVSWLSMMLVPLRKHSGKNPTGWVVIGDLSLFKGYDLKWVIVVSGTALSYNGKHNDKLVIRSPAKRQHDHDMTWDAEKQIQCMIKEEH